MAVYRDYHQIYYPTVMVEEPMTLIVLFLLIVSNPIQLSVSFQSSAEENSENGVFMYLGMPVLEDGLSDSENVSGDERSPPVRTKSTNRHQSTQSDFLFQSPPSTLIPSHKHQFAKSTQHEPESQIKTFPTQLHTSASTAIQTSQQQRTVSDESQAITAGRLNCQEELIERVKTNFRYKTTKEGFVSHDYLPP